MALGSEPVFSSYRSRVVLLRVGVRRGIGSIFLALAIGCASKPKPPNYEPKINSTPIEEPRPAPKEHPVPGLPIKCPQGMGASYDEQAKRWRCVDPCVLVPENPVHRGKTASDPCWRTDSCGVPRDVPCIF